MNKEVLYLEPEDDITDILTKLQQTEQKLVALVPPKKTTILRSSVNMKLIARVSKECEKIVVIVSQDPAIVKAAMLARIPVAKTLQSRPVIPTEENIRAAEADFEEIGEDEPTEAAEKAPKPSGDDAHTAEGTSAKPQAAQGKNALDIEFDDEELAKGQKDEKKSKKDKKSKITDPNANFFVKYKKWFMIGTPIVLVLIIFMVWALVFAPSASVTVAISSTPSNFSENVQFATDNAKANISEGIFYAEEQKLEQKQTTELSSTTSENQGDLSKGTLTVSTAFSLKDSDAFSYDIPEGAIFISSAGKRYAATSSASISWDGTTIPSSCTNTSNCRLSATVEIAATRPGEEYDLAASSSWEDYDDLTVSNSKAITGGSTSMVKIVSQSEVDKAVEAKLSEITEEGRKMLLEDIEKLENPVIAISSSFKAEAKDVVVKPAVGEKIEGDKAEITFVAVYHIYTVAKDSVEQFIKEKTYLPEDQKVYSVGEPYFERFTEITETARLKSIIETGPIVSEDIVFDKIKGHKIGEVQSILKSVTGINSVNVETSYFWVNSVPDDRSKVTITIEGQVEEGEAQE